MAQSKLKLVVEAEVKKALKDLDKVNSKIKSGSKETTHFSGAFGKLGKAMMGLAAGIASVSMLKTVITETSKAYEKQVLAEQKLKAALKATNGAVGISYKGMVDYADALSKTTTYGDEEIISAESLMTTFTKIGKETFPDAIKAASDMSAMFGTDLQQSVVSLGTALNDPIAGVGRLKRVGVSFTASQKKMIESFVKSGQVEKAQRAILKELNNEFGGVAETIGKSVIGSTKRLNNAWGDLKEQGGRSLLTTLQPAVDYFTKLLNRMTETAKFSNDLRDSYKKVADGTAKTVDKTRVLQDEYVKTNDQIKELKSSMETLQAIGQQDNGNIKKRINDLKKENTVRLAKIKALALQEKGEAELQKTKEDDAENQKKIAEQQAAADEKKKKYKEWLSKEYGKTKAAQKEILEKELQRVEANLSIAKTTDWDYKKLIAVEKMLKKQLGTDKEQTEEKKKLNEYQQKKLDLENQIYNVEKQRIGKTGAEKKYYDDKLKSLQGEYKELTKISGEEKKQPDYTKKIVSGWEKAKKEVDKYSGVINGLKGVYSAWDNLQQNSLSIYEKTMDKKIDKAQEEADAEAEIINGKYDDEKTALQDALNNDVITKEEYNERLKKIDDKRNKDLTAAYKEKKDLEKQLTDRKNKEAKRRFEIDKAEQIVEATINGATAIVKGFAELGPIGGAIAAVMVAATTATQIALIKKQKYVPLKEGGIVDKPTNALIGEGGEPEMVLPLSKAEKMGFGGKSNNLTINITGNIYGINDLYTQVKNGIEKLQKTGTLNKWQYI